MRIDDSGSRIEGLLHTDEWQGLKYGIPDSSYASEDPRYWSKEWWLDTHISDVGLVSHV
jgi:hypothetical protein